MKRSHNISTGLERETNFPGLEGSPKGGGSGSKGPGVSNCSARRGEKGAVEHTAHGEGAEDDAHEEPRGRWGGLVATKGRSSL